MAEYQFVTRWQVTASIEKVWAALIHSEEWPSWWKAVESVVELEAGEPSGIGSVRQFVWKTPLSYTLAFNTHVTQIQAPTMMEAVAIGDVEGHGLWQLATTEHGTEIVYTWTVRTTKPWMNYLAAIARPLLEWNHHAIMRQGGQGLAQWLQAELLNVESVAQSQSRSKIKLH